MSYQSEITEAEKLAAEAKKQLDAAAVALGKARAAKDGIDEATAAHKAAHAEWKRLLPAGMKAIEAEMKRLQGQKLAGADLVAADEDIGARHEAVAGWR